MLNLGIMDTESSTFTSIRGINTSVKKVNRLLVKTTYRGAKCVSLFPKIKHTATPVESKEKKAEVWLRDMFKSADILLFEQACLTRFGAMLQVALDAAIAACLAIRPVRRRLIKCLLESGLVGTKFACLDVVLIS